MPDTPNTPNTPKTPKTPDTSNPSNASRTPDPAPADAAASTPASVTPAGVTPTPSGKSETADAMAQAALQAAKDAIAGLADMTVEAANAGGGQAEGDGALPPELPTFDSVGVKAPPKGIDLLGDVNLNVKIELGRTRMLVEDVLKLGEGAVVELDKLAGDPVDVYVNDRPIARGEVLVLNDNFCVRIHEILPLADPSAQSA